MGLTTTTSTRRWAILAVIVTLVAAVLTASLGFVLAATYRPWFGEPWNLPARAERDLDWLRWHGWATAGFVFTSLTTVVIVVWDAIAAERRRVLTLVAAPLAFVTAVLTAITRGLVEWDQLAIRSVTVGSDIDGYWTAAFSDDVVFVIVDGVEVTQGEYAWSLVVHLGAPVIGGLVLAALAVQLARRRTTPVSPTDTVS